MGEFSYITGLQLAEEMGIFECQKLGTDILCQFMISQLSWFDGIPGVKMKYELHF